MPDRNVGVLLLFWVTAACIAPGPVVSTESADPVVDTIVIKTEPSRYSTLAPIPPLPPLRQWNSEVLPERSSRTVSDRSLAGRTIVVDAGHGGKDPGAKALSVVPEKVITLAIARLVAKQLEQKGARVYLTRSDDRFIELKNRAGMADRVRADLLVSIHADSVESSRAHGFAVWVARGALSSSKKAAAAIMRAAVRQKIVTRTIHKANFVVLAQHQRPSVLVETGFLSNKTDARLLNTSSYRQRIAWAVADGVADALGR